MLAKALIIAIFAAIVYFMGSALMGLARGKAAGGSARSARALTARISLSVGLFALLFLLWAAGIIEPHGVNGG